MQSNDMRIFIRINTRVNGKIDKTDLIQYNKKSISTLTINGESFSQKRFAFLLRLVIFSNALK